MSNIIKNAMRTPDGTIIESQHRHDYVTHKDKNGKEYILDGGLDYIKSSANGDEEYLTVTDSDSHEVVREALTWGTYGKDGKSPFHHITLSNMETAHIEACLDTQPSMYPQIRTAMKTELAYREMNA